MLMKSVVCGCSFTYVPFGSDTLRTCVQPGTWSNADNRQQLVVQNMVQKNAPQGISLSLAHTAMRTHLYHVALLQHQVLHHLGAQNTRGWKTVHGTSCGMLHL
jgi:hypothetical protein